MFVITADQRDSRANVDLVPAGIALVERVAADRLAVPVERNAGDELQALTGDAAAALEIALALLRDGRWSVGLGVGAVEKPIPADIRAARGPAFVLARDAVERAKGASGRVALASGDPVAAEDAEAYLRLLVDLRDRRSAQGWEVADLLAEGHDPEAHRGPAGHHADGGEPASEGGGPATGGGGDPRPRAHAGGSRPTAGRRRRERLTACQ